MPRQARLVVPDLPVHIVHRGINRQCCFGRDGDYLVYLALLQAASRKFGCQVHAYCLMTNHVHVLATPGSAQACGAMMHGVAQRYAHYFNKRTARTGPLWEGRFRSCIVESARYVLACYRYIELNPVRAGMVSSPEAYSWSSAAANSRIRGDALLTPHNEYQALAATEYRRLLSSGMEPDVLREIRESTNTGFPLASGPFKDRLGSSVGRRLVARRAGRPRKADDTKESVDVPDLFSGGAAS
jgi:putative transposase